MKFTKLIFIGLLATTLTACKNYTPEDEQKALNYCAKYKMNTYTVPNMFKQYRAAGYVCRREGTAISYKVPDEVLSK